jgi:hypothetical protein
MLMQTKAPLHPRQLGKSIAHSQIQHHLKKQIPEIELEKTVGRRRADALWEAKKIVFEIQTSPITHEQALLRSQDYVSYGYQIVWILHEKEFNHRKSSLAERFLRHSYPTYYTTGAIFYDQIECFDGKTRRYKGDPLPVQLNAPSPPFLKIPHRSWPLQFIGDLHTWCALHGTGELNKIHYKHAPSQGLKYWAEFLGYRLLEFVSSG